HTLNPVSSFWLWTRFHRITEKTIDISTLVTSHESSPLYMALVCENHRIRHLI
ncbi:unnamed protein product, partial [Heterotrigona itama]